MGFKMSTSEIMAFICTFDVLATSMVYVIAAPQRLKNLCRLFLVLQEFDKLLEFKLHKKTNLKIKIFHRLFIIYLINAYFVDFFMWGFFSLQAIIIDVSYYWLHSIIMIVELSYWHLVMMIFYRIKALNSSMNYFLNNIIGNYNITFHYLLIVNIL